MICPRRTPDPSTTACRKRGPPGPPPSSKAHLPLSQPTLPPSNNALISSAQSSLLVPRSSLVLIVYHTQHHAAICHVSTPNRSPHIPQRLDHLRDHRRVHRLRSCESRRALSLLYLFLVSPVTRAIAYSLRRQNILFLITYETRSVSVVSPQPPEKNVLRRHEPGCGNLVLWCLSTQDLTRCICGVNSHILFARIHGPSPVRCSKGQRSVEQRLVPNMKSKDVSPALTFDENALVVNDCIAYPRRTEDHSRTSESSRPRGASAMVFAIRNRAYLDGLLAS